MENTLRTLGKSVLISVELTAVSKQQMQLFRSTTYEENMKKISYEEKDDIMKIVKYLEEFGLLIKVSAKQSKLKQKNKGVGFLACYQAH